MCFFLSGRSLALDHGLVYLHRTRAQHRLYSCFCDYCDAEITNNSDDEELTPAAARELATIIAAAGEIDQLG